jgi:DNA-binding transcriptional ArsR family regulator
MDKESCEKLVQAVYRVTELFPESEPLRKQIRESANQILADLICLDSKKQAVQLLKNIEVIKSYLKLAQTQNWVDPINFVVLQKEYSKMEEVIKSDIGKTVDNFSPEAKKETLATEKDRRNRILDFLRERKSMQTRELVEAFPKTNRRTLIRDLDKLYQSGILIRVGSGRSSSYNIKL